MTAHIGSIPKNSRAFVLYAVDSVFTTCKSPINGLSLISMFYSRLRSKKHIFKMCMFLHKSLCVSWMTFNLAHDSFNTFGRQYQLLVIGGKTPNNMLEVLDKQHTVTKSLLQSSFIVT